MLARGPVVVDQTGRALTVNAKIVVGWRERPVGNFLHRCRQAPQKCRQRRVLLSGQFIGLFLKDVGGPSETRERRPGPLKIELDPMKQRRGNVLRNQTLDKGEPICRIIAMDLHRHRLHDGPYRIKATAAAIRFDAHGSVGHFGEAEKEKRMFSMLALALAGVVATPAQTSSAPTAEQQKLICKHETTVNSRFTKKRCLTKAQRDLVEEKSKREAAEMINKPHIYDCRPGGPC
jgi:hypothetical protein